MSQSQSLSLIGLAGFKRSGKDTAAKAFVRMGYRRVAFADALREEVFDLYPQARDIPDESKEVPQAFLQGRSLRDVLIEVATRRRSEDPDYWVRIARERIQAYLQEGSPVVISDVRMDNEIALVREFGGLLVWIARPGVVSNGHDTERDLCALCDIRVHNLGSREDLERKMAGILGGHCGSCSNMLRNRDFPQYGSCKLPRDMMLAARLVNTFTPCWQNGYAPMPGFTPKTPQKKNRS